MSIASAVMHDARVGRWLSFGRPRAVIEARRVGEVLPALRRVEEEVGRGAWAAGFVAYEASPAFDPALLVGTPGPLPLLWFGICGEPEVVPPPASTEGDEAASPDWRPTLDRAAYDAAIARIKKYIRAGDTYQVNYTLRLRARPSPPPWPLFRRLLGAQRPRYGAYLETADWAVCSASPELFFEWDDGGLVSIPMKGTMPRGLWSDDDDAMAKALRTSAKNRAENIMIVDMVRNDMGRVADTGSVAVARLHDVERYPAMWQMTSTVRCSTKAGITGIFSAMFPPASITGAPKPRTMGIIAELEATPRGVYTGAVGFISPRRRAQFNVAIRTAVVDTRSGTAEYGTGGGIVWDSTAESEFEECAVKAGIVSGPCPGFDLLETMLWEPGEGVFLLDRHLDRLRGSAGYFARPLDSAALRSMIVEATRALPAVPHRLRLTVPEGSPPAIEVRPLSPLSRPYRICMAKQPVDESDPFLYHKTTRRDTYERAKTSCPGFDDVLLWNRRGEITETCIANVAVETGGERFTPPVRCGLLPGICRAHLLEQGVLKERVIRLDELRPRTRILLINSVRREWGASLESEG